MGEYPEGHSPRWWRRHPDKLAEARISTSVEVSPLAHAAEPTIWEKLLIWFEHAWVIAALCTIGTLLGFFYSPVLALCGIAILFAFHRVGVVRGYKPWIQILAYCILFVVVTAIWYRGSLLIKQNLPHIPTAEENAEAFAKKLPSMGGPPASESAKHTNPQDVDPFAVTVTWALPAIGNFKGWVVDEQTKSGYRVDLYVVLRLVNLQDRHSLESFSVAVNIGGQWVPLNLIEINDNYHFYRGQSENEACKTDMSYPNIVSSFSKEFTSGEMRRGIGFFQLPSQVRSSNYPNIFQVTLKLTNGHTQTFTSPPIGKQGEEEAPFAFTNVKCGVNLSRFTFERL